MANIKQVAALAGLSASCVSKYLKDASSVRPSSREQIESAIKELNYVPSAIARNLRSRRTGIIKIISHSITNQFFAELFEMIRTQLESLNYIAALQSIRYMEEKQFSKLDFDQVDGVILCYIENRRTLDSLQNNLPQNFPVVNIHGTKSIQGVSTIITDLKRGASDATEYLIREGRTNIAYIGAREDSTISSLKYNGYLEAIKTNTERVNYATSRDNDFSMQSGYDASKELFNKDQSIDAILCENDLLAAGAIHFFYDIGRRIPEDISIIGYDDIPLASMFIPPISSVAIPTEEISIIACTELNSMMNSGNGRDHIIQPKLVVRKSTENL